jgi:hypothetical protein
MNRHDLHRFVGPSATVSASSVPRCSLRPALRCAALGSLLLILGIGTAGADEPIGDDEVTLKDGGTLRGTVLSSEPGLGIQLLEYGQKEPRAISWDRVASVERGKFARRSSPPSRQNSSAPSDPSASAAHAVQLGKPGVVRLHVESPTPVQVFSHRYATQQASYGTSLTSGAGQGGLVIGGTDGDDDNGTMIFDTPRAVCTSPCDLLVDGSRGQFFTVGGVNANESGPFTLAGLTGDQRLNVSPGSPGLRSAGMYMLGGAGLAIGTGIFFLVYGAGKNSQEQVEQMSQIGTKPPSGSSAGGGFITAGGIVLGSAAALLIGGIVSVLSSRTTADLHPSGVGERKPRYWAGEF